MKAMIWTKYGSPDVLQLKEVAKPTPKGKEVLVRIYATTVTASDCELRSLKVPIWLRFPLRIYLGLFRPRNKILGQEFAGEVEAVGNEVTRFKMGDQVFGWTGLDLGAYAEYTCVPETGIVAIKPTNMTYEEAAPLPVGGLEAVHLLQKAQIQNGEKILIYGAGGSIGTIAVQFARHLGAEVTAVDSTGKLEMLRSIGASHVIDYTQTDFTKNGETYDVIFDVVGKSSFSRSLKSLKPNGRYLLANPKLSQMIRGRRTLKESNKTVIPYAAKTESEIIEDFKFLKDLSETGKIQSVIDRRYPLEQTVEAHRYVDTGQKKGNVVITITHTT